MINPVLSNFEITFGNAFFPEGITEKYNKFLRYKNYPFKTLISYFYETIQNLDMPGINLQTISANGLSNLGQSKVLGNVGEKPKIFQHTTINRHYPGTAPINEIIDGIIISITFRNTLINWMYCYEVLHSYYDRTRSIEEFYILLTMKDSAENPIIRFKLSDCFISTMPGLSFAFNSAFNTSKTFDVGFVFNKFDVDFIISDFNLIEKTF